MVVYMSHFLCQPREARICPLYTALTCNRNREMLMTCGNLWGILGYTQWKVWGLYPGPFASRGKNR